MLIDDFLSDFDFVETHEISIRADAREIYRAANEVDFESLIIRWLMQLRGVGRHLRLTDLARFKFQMLGETLDKEMVIGLVGRFWSLGGGLQRMDAERFKGFNKPGYAKAVWNFSLNDDEDGTRLTTETRIKCLDAKSLASFGWYWTFVRPLAD